MAIAPPAPSARDDCAALKPIAGLSSNELGQIAQVWHAALATTMEDAPPVDALLQRFSRDLSACEIAVVRDDERIVAFIACDRAQRWLRQLFVDPTRHGTGLGTRLLMVAIEAMPGGWLRTDATNLRARRFYERRGLAELWRRPHPITGAPTIVYGWR